MATEEKQIVSERIISIQAVMGVDGDLDLPEDEVRGGPYYVSALNAPELAPPSGDDFFYVSDFTGPEIQLTDVYENALFFETMRSAKRAAAELVTEGFWVTVGLDDLDWDQMPSGTKRVV